MKNLYILFSLLLTSAAFAQSPAPGQRLPGFQSKLKTAPPTPGLAERLGADVVPLPTRRTATSARLTGGLANQPALLRVVRDPATGLPILIENRRPVTASAASRSARLSATQVRQTASAFLKQVGHLLQVERPDEQFSITSTETDELGYTHVRLRQTYAGVPVYGGDLVLHMAAGQVTALNGRYHRLPAGLPTRPRLSRPQALALARRDLGRAATMRIFGPSLNVADEPGELCYYRTGDSLRLAYALTVRPSLLESWDYKIDALTGTVLDKINTVCSVDGPKSASARDLNGVTRTVQTYQSGGTYYLIDASRPMFDANGSKMPDDPAGVLWTIDARNSVKDLYQNTSASNTDWTPTATSAHYNVGTAYEYYRSVHGRNALDGKGGSIISVINVAADSTGKGLDNAYWNGKLMVYGNGNKLFKPLAGGLDVAGHELTHGVTQNSAGLEYKAQSGAINESMSDVFGALIDRKNWQIGEDVVKPAYFPSGALRDLSNPNQGGKTADPYGYQPRTMAQYEDRPVTAAGDNGGVHINSGIPNYAFYLFATAPAVGKDKAEKVYYRVLTQYLTRTSQFLDLRLAVIQAAGDLYGAGEAEVAAARAAFDAVGITEQSAPNPQPNPNVPVAQGTDLLLLTDTDQQPNLLYSTVIGQNPPQFSQKSQSAPQQRPSLTDDGRFAYFVGADKRIRAVDLTASNATEQIISNETIWRNVAISKDGTKLAALTDQKDASIWVYSFALKKWTKFGLYNPTTAEGVKNNTVQYADSFEWDFAGEYLVYDAYNKASGNVTVDYWDVNFIRVWDKTQNTFAAGDIEKLISDLNNGESIGNPSFARNSTNVLAFDYFNETDNTYAVLAANLDQGDLKLVYKNNTLGFPAYSRLDDRLVFDTQASSGREDIAMIGLGADKISPAGDAQTIYTGAKWPIWYTQGQRQSQQQPKTAQTITFGTLADRYTDAPDQPLTATASSGLPVSFAVMSGPATLTSNALRVTGAGVVRVRASQAGNGRYSAAPPVDQSFTVYLVTGLEPAWSTALKLYPNPASTSLTVELDGQPLEVLTLTNLTGSVVQHRTAIRSAKAQLSLSDLPAGIYLITVETATGVAHRKIIKE